MTTSLHQLRKLGQSVWYDTIRRALLDSGRLREYVDDYAVTGVTSNPSIFEKAISGSSDYDAQLAIALRRGLRDPEDGFVSLELPPRLSRNARGSIELGIELFARLDRPNVMIKVPGTPEGAEAIEELIAAGGLPRDPGLRGSRGRHRAGPRTDPHRSA